MDHRSVEEEKGHILRRSSSSEDRRSRTRREAVWNRSNISPRRTIGETEHENHAVHRRNTTATARRRPGSVRRLLKPTGHSAGDILGGGGGGVIHMRTLTPDSLQWIPDHERMKCKVCTRVFGNFSRRKHHCRFCGEIFCNDCAPIDRSLGIRSCESCLNTRRKIEDQARRKRAAFREGKRARARLSVLSFGEIHRMFRPVETCVVVKSGKERLASAKSTKEISGSSHDEESVRMPPPLPPIPASLRRVSCAGEKIPNPEVFDRTCFPRSDSDDARGKWLNENMDIKTASDVLTRHTNWLASYDERCDWYDLHADFQLCHFLLNSFSASDSDVLEFVRQSFKCSDLVRRIRLLSKCRGDVEEETEIMVREVEEIEGGGESGKRSTATDSNGGADSKKNPRSSMRPTLDKYRKALAVQHSLYCTAARRVNEAVKTQIQSNQTADGKSTRDGEEEVEDNDRISKWEVAVNVCPDEKKMMVSDPIEAIAHDATALETGRRRNRRGTISCTDRQRRNSESYQRILRPVRGLTKTPSGRYVEEIEGGPPLEAPLIPEETF